MNPFTSSFYRCLLLLIAGIFLGACSPSPSKLESNSEVPETPKVSSKKSPLYYSSDQGLSWVSCGEGLPPEAWITYVLGQDGELVVGTEAHGVWKSTENKTTWKSIGQDLPGKKINALFVNKDKIYTGVFQKGIFQTEDGGKHWESLNLDLPNLSVMNIAGIGEELLIATDAGIFKSREGQSRWEAVYEGPQVVSLSQMGETWFAGGVSGVLRSVDEGETWEVVDNKGALHMTAIVNEVVVAMYINGVVTASSDEGKTWQVAKYGPTGGSYVYEAIGAGDQMLMSNNYGVHRSTNKGKTWTLDYKQKAFIFFDFWAEGDLIYGGVREFKDERPERIQSLINK